MSESNTSQNQVVPADRNIVQPVQKTFVPPSEGELITSLRTNNTYTIGQQIGEGNFGIVYGCTDIWRNELAVKVLKPIKTYDAVRAEAEAEFTKLVALRHPNTTYIHDAFEYRDTFYIITERCFCPVSSLFAMPDFHGLTWVMPIARCLLQAVHFLHVNNVVHQDIHPGNVFTTFVRDEMPTEGTAIQFKLADLGVAKLFEEVDGENTRNQSILPPEVVSPTEYGPMDHHIDIYNVGLLLLQLAISKERVFTPEEVLSGTPREIAVTLPPPLNFALSKALRRHVPYRTSDAMKLWRDLNTIMPATPPLLPDPPPSTPEGSDPPCEKP